MERLGEGKDVEAGGEGVKGEVEAMGEEDEQ